MPSSAYPGGASSEHTPLDDSERRELADLRARKGGTHHVRSALSAVLLVLAALLAPLSVVAVWAADTVGDTGRYVATVGPLASKPDVQKAVSRQVTDALVARIDLDTLISQAVPSDRPLLRKALGPLRKTVTDGVRDLVQQQVTSFVASDRFAVLWRQLNRRAHAAFLGALTGDSDTAVQVRGDEVVLDLAPVVDQVKQRLADQGLTVARHIPTVHTEYTLLRSEKVHNARTGFRLLQLVGNWLPVATVVAAAAGVLLAVRRRRAVVTIALAIAVTVALLGVALSVFRVFYLDQLPAGSNEFAAGTVYDQLVRFLRVSVRSVVVLALVVALGAWLSGPETWAVRVRGFWESGISAAREGAGIRSTGAVGTWVHRCRRVLRWIVVLVAAVVLLVWSYPTAMVVFWIALTALGALAVIEFLDDQPRRSGAPERSGPGERPAHGAGSSAA
ncbi:hypothetical protein [Actinacidiphila yeochonensis]|uniref:hypothetical protein n=1 Tax=Actinacidiphila yeochonensis TaxID=89050 RepID=UPI00068AEA5F|nr:hypothetical protein [Actinacidiphila yeochonensis]